MFSNVAMDHQGVQSVCLLLLTHHANQPAKIMGPVTKVFVVVLRALLEKPVLLVSFDDMIRFMYMVQMYSFVFYAIHHYPSRVSRGTK